MSLLTLALMVSCISGLTCVVAVLTVFGIGFDVESMQHFVWI